MPILVLMLIIEFSKLVQNMADNSTEAIITTYAINSQREIRINQLTGLICEPPGRIMELQTIFHGLAVVWYLLLDLQMAVLGIAVLLTRWDILFNQYGIGIQYFTLWNLAAQQIYFMGCLYNDLTPKTNKFKPLMQTNLTKLFYSVILPFACVLSADFWFLYRIDPQLIDAFHALEDLLACVNHSLHSMIVPIVIVELFLTSCSPQDIKVWKVLRNLAIIHFMYGCVVYTCYCLGNVWPYPFLGMLTLPQQVVVALFNSLGGVACFVLAKHIKITFNDLLAKQLKRS